MRDLRGSNLRFKLTALIVAVSLVAWSTDLLQVSKSKVGAFILPVSLALFKVPSKDLGANSDPPPKYSDLKNLFQFHVKLISIRMRLLQ